MDRSIYMMNVALAGFYCILFILYVRSFFSVHRPLGGLFVWALPVVLTLHLVKLIVQGVAGGHCPLIGVGESFSFMAFCLGFIYFIVERYQKYFGTGAIFIGLVLLFQAISLLAPASASYLPEVMGRIPIGFHAPVALMGIAGLATSAVYGALYLTMYYMLKHKHFGHELNEMPPLETIERMQTLSATIGLVLVAVSLVAGFVIGIIYNQPMTIFDSKIVASVIVILIFGYGVVGSYFYSFSGRKRSVVALVGFAVALISMTVIRFCLPTFHRF